MLSVENCEQSLFCSKIRGEKRKEERNTSQQFAGCILIRCSAILLQVTGREKALETRLLEPAYSNSVIISNTKPFHLDLRRFQLFTIGYFELVFVSPDESSE